MSRTRYALVGTGGRAQFFYKAIARNFQDTSSIVAFCDVNQTRMDYANQNLQEAGHPAVPTYKSEQFDQMIEEQKPDAVIVTTVDRTHHKYIIRAMELGCDVLTEKPMTVDAEKCQAILDTVNRTGRNLRVTFNYRYSPHNTKIRELIADGAIGDVTQVHFEWLLNTKHGADYFRRWHRDKRNSGGLLVHKSTHHFDLVNFWLGSEPKTVFAQGDLMFYGRENAENRGITEFYSRAKDSEHAKEDPFAIDLNKGALKAMYSDAEHEDGYYRDQSVFGDGISIEDTMSVIVRYKNKAMLTYSLYAYSPWEGFRVSFNGTKGRIEMNVIESSYVNSGGDQALEGAVVGKKITVHPMFGQPYEAKVVEGKGGHGGGDPVLLNDLFGAVKTPDPFNRAASHVDGAMSILTGIAANVSLRTELPVKVDTLVKF